jgi:hypothetical protein
MAWVAAASITSNQEVSVRSNRPAIKLALGVAAGLALTLPASLPAAAAAPADTRSSSAATWTLLQFNQQVCSQPGGWPGTYVLATLKGSWSKTVRTGIRNLPPGSSSLGGSSIPPGSNDGERVLSLIHLSIAPTPVGVYHAEVWASDGKVTQTDSVTINVRERC